MIAQTLSNGQCACTDLHANIKHTSATLLAKEITVALNKLNKETLYLMLKIGSHQVNTAPRCKIYRTQV
jgi:hypothetical protein